MYLSKLQLQNLRCFSDKELEFDQKITLIEGLNGSGKTTIIEALYYLCYLRSFRTNITQDLISFERDSFFIKALLLKNASLEQETLQVGFSPAKRLVKLNNQPIESFKQLVDSYRVVVLTEDDLNIIQGGPEVRRSFIDQYIYLQNPNWSIEMRNYKRVIDNRNALLKSKNFDLEHYQVWTDQVIKRSELVRNKRIMQLQALELEINQILASNFNEEFAIEFAYQQREWQKNMQHKEQIMERTLFGAHLDDYQIKLCSQFSRKFASRGQQKLVAILMKIVQVKLLKQRFNGAILFLLDDFVTDFDEHKITTLFNILHALEVQLVFTAPNLDQKHKNILINYGAKVILV